MARRVVQCHRMHAASVVVVRHSSSSSTFGDRLWERLSVEESMVARNFRYVFALNTVVNWRLISHVQVPEKSVDSFCTRSVEQTTATVSHGGGGATGQAKH